MTTDLTDLSVLRMGTSPELSSSMPLDIAGIGDVLASMGREHKRALNENLPCTGIFDRYQSTLDHGSSVTAVFSHQFSGPFHQDLCPAHPETPRTASLNLSPGILDNALQGAPHVVLARQRARSRSDKKGRSRDRRSYGASLFQR